MIKKKAKQAINKVKNKATNAVKTSAKKHPVIWILIVVAILVLLFVLTPTTNPIETKLDFGESSEALAIPAYSKDDIIVQHTGYTLCYSEEHEQPYWVAYLLTADEVFANESSRNENFREDPSIPTGSATLADYKKSGYDRGHLCPAADQAWSAQAMDDSFYLSNMSPQTHTFNAGIWLELEKAVRTIAAQNQEVYVVTGPVLTDGPYETIGSNKVSVPNSFYKVILDYYGQEKKAIGFVLRQDDKGKLKNFAVSVDYVEELTGIDFFASLSDKEEEALESTFDVSLWDLSEFDRTKTAKRYGYDLSSGSYNEDSVVLAVKSEPQGIIENVRYFLYCNLGSYKIMVIDFVKNLI